MHAITADVWSVLILTTLLIVSWLTVKLPLKNVGVSIAPSLSWLIGLGHPMFVMLVILFVACRTQVFDSLDDLMASAARLNDNLLMFLLFMHAIIAELFFRGWLFAYLKTKKYTSTVLIGVTAVSFTVWQLGWYLFSNEFSLAIDSLLVLTVQLLLIGIIWGKMRHHTGVVWASMIAHLFWSFLALHLFGWCQSEEAIFSEQLAIYSPDQGFLGIIFNGVFLWIYWIYTKDG